MIGPREYWLKRNSKKKVKTERGGIKTQTLKRKLPACQKFQWRKEKEGKEEEERMRKYALRYTVAKFLNLKNTKKNLQASQQKHFLKSPCKL